MFWQGPIHFCGNHPPRTRHSPHDVTCTQLHRVRMNMIGQSTKREWLNPDQIDFGQPSNLPIILNQITNQRRGNRNINRRKCRPYVAARVEIQGLCTIYADFPSLMTTQNLYWIAIVMRWIPCQTWECPLRGASWGHEEANPYLHLTKHPISCHLHHDLSFHIAMSQTPSPLLDIGLVATSQETTCILSPSEENYAKSSQ